jgi:hypothetical protein
MEIATASAVVVLWYGMVYLAARPWVDAPVVDSWAYADAVRNFIGSGKISFNGFAQAMPASMVVYGSAWTFLFGGTYISLNISVALLGVVGAILFFDTARMCGASRNNAMLATGLLVANPCYLFLSFSFMTDVPFLCALIAAHWAFAIALKRGSMSYLWISAAFAIIAFLVRPFALAIIVASALVLLLRREEFSAASSRSRMKTLLPSAAALLGCMAAWIWLTVLNPEPWMLKLSMQRLRYVFDVSFFTYLRRGIVNPLLYFGIVLSPICLLAANQRRYRAAAIAIVLLAVTAISLSFDRTLPWTVGMSCLGGGYNSLMLRGGTSTEFAESHLILQLMMVVLGSIGAAGLISGAARLRSESAPTRAIVFTALIYWCATLPLWFFNNRYDLPLLPAMCLVLALATGPITGWRLFGSIVILVAIGFFSAAAVYDHQRGLAMLIEARNSLERSGVPREQIDAGYPLNAEDIHLKSSDSRRDQVPMVTSARMAEFTIAATPVPGSEIVRRLQWPGPFGFGNRELLVMRAKHPS